MLREKSRNPKLVYREGTGRRKKKVTKQSITVDVTKEFNVENGLYVCPPKILLVSSLYTGGVR